MKKVILSFLLLSAMALSCLAGERTPEEILAGMTLEEKAGQVIVGAFRGNAMSDELRDSIARLKFGGLIFFSAAGNITDTAQVSSLISSAQEVAMKEGSKIPLLITIDQEGGLVARIRNGVTVWPGNMALGATDDTALAELQAEIMARELRTLGFNWNFAPVADVNSNPLNPIIGVRSFGSDPEKVSLFVEAMMRGFAKGGVVSTVKHFPGHGDTAVDSHYGLPSVNKTLPELEQMELLPFRRAIAAGVPAVMTSHIIVPAIGAKDVPVTLSKEAISFLRNEMGFKGLVLTDALIGMKAIEDNWGSVEGAVLSLNAGVDMLIFGFRASELYKIYPIQKAAHERIAAAVRSGELPAERLDEAVLRILRQKSEMRLSETIKEELAALSSVETAQRVSDKSITLLRDKLIPLDFSKKTILVWRSDMNSSSSSLLNALPRGVELVELPRFPFPNDFERLKAEAADADNVIAGTFALYEGIARSDKSSIAWQKCLEQIPPEKLILIALRTPYDINALPKTETYIAAYSDIASSMKAVAKVLTGELVPSGKLPVLF